MSTLGHCECFTRKKTTVTFVAPLPSPPLPFLILAFCLSRLAPYLANHWAPLQWRITCPPFALTCLFRDFMYLYMHFFEFVLKNIILLV